MESISNASGQARGWVESPIWLTQKCECGAGCDSENATRLVFAGL